MGLALVPWSPLAGGFLSGKYHRGQPRTPGEGRLSTSNPFGDTKFTDRDFDVLDVLREVSVGLGRAPAEVALAWLLGRTGVDSVVVGARTPEQLTSALEAADHTLPIETRDRLDTASAPELGYPYEIFTEQMQAAVVGGGRPVRRLRP